MPITKTILIVAGDPSGDLHGAQLIRELKARGLHIAAVGGPLMKREADEFLEDLASRGITGFWEPMGKAGLLIRLGLRLKRFLEDRRPSALVCIDYYGFNRRILPLARQAGVPAYYYISPQVWASRPGRIQTLKRFVRKMLVIFPFEEALYKNAGVPCKFVGHPLLDILPQAPLKERVNSPLTVGLLPGSRATEVQRHLSIFRQAFKLFKRDFPDSKALVFASPNLSDRAYAAGGPDVEIVRDTAYQQRMRLDLALCSSGTATLENALLGIPMVVVYKMSWPTYAIARAIINVKNIAMANLLAQKSLVPELIQRQATPERISQSAKSLLENPRRYQHLRQELLSLRSLLGQAGAARRAAQEILLDLPS